MLCSFSRLLVLMWFWVGLDCSWIWADVYGFRVEGFGVLDGWAERVWMGFDLSWLWGIVV